jgi:GNAT superfamily N-acetyltransferase
MLDEERAGERLRPIERVVIGPVGIDDWSDVRHVHAFSLEKLAAVALDPDEFAAIREWIASPEYTEELQNENLAAAWLDRHMIGTCGWCPADDAGSSARITSLFVSPLFTRLGVGRALLLDAERRAQVAGFASFTLRTAWTALGFFEALGYEVSSYGNASISGGRELPAVFMRKCAL